MSPFLAWVDFHARSRFARSTIPEEKWGTTRSLSRMGDLAVLNGHKRRTNSVSITTQEFVFRNKNRKRRFGTSGNFKN